MTNLKETLKGLVAYRGPNAIIKSVDTTIHDLKSLGYTKEEISETLREEFYGIEDTIDKYIEEKGY